MLAHLIALISLAPAAVGGDVLVVDRINGPYFDLQSAVDAAADGDTLLVKPGTFLATTIAHKGLSVVADGGIVRVLGGLVIENTLSHHEVLLSGLQLLGERDQIPVYIDQPGLALTTVRGPVRVEDCTIVGEDATESCDWAPAGACAGGDAVRIQDGLDVVFARCTIRGGHGVEFFVGQEHNAGGHAIAIEGGSVSVHGCTLEGGDGWSSIHTGQFLDEGGDGGDGVNARGSGVLPVVVHLSGTTAAGGIGGDGELCICMGGDGGDGVHAIGLDAEVWLLDNLLTGEPAGCGGGSPTNGLPLRLEAGAVSTTFTGNARGLTAGGPVRETWPAPVTFHGQPGDRVLLLQSVQPAFHVRAPFSGVHLLATPGLQRRRFAGVIGASGDLAWSLEVGALPMGVESAVLYTQSAHFDTTGRVFLGSAWTLLVLDTAF